MSCILQIENLSHKYDEQVVFYDLFMDLKAGQLLSLLGESGCGKTTLLRDIAGLQEPSKGNIFVHDTCVFSKEKHINTSPSKRGIGLVFQEYALFPALTVAENIIFGLHNMDSISQKKCLDELVEQMGITDLQQRYPHELSGGQQQRVALARSLAPKPKLLLLDEPFANLDTTRTHDLAYDIKIMLKKTNTAAILVTHDQNDALKFSDTIAILEKETPQKPAHFSQIDIPEKIYNQPQTQQIAETFGVCSHITGKVHQGTFQTIFGSFTNRLSNTFNSNQTKILLREEDIQISACETQSEFHFVESHFLGSGYRIICRHISSDQKIIGLSVRSICTTYVHVQFINKEGFLFT